MLVCRKPNPDNDGIHRRLRHTSSSVHKGSRARGAPVRRWGFAESPPNTASPPGRSFPLSAAAPSGFSSSRFCSSCSVIWKYSLRCSACPWRLRSSSEATVVLAPSKRSVRQQDLIFQLLWKCIGQPLRSHHGRACSAGVEVRLNVVANGWRDFGKILRLGAHYRIMEILCGSEFDGRLVPFAQLGMIVVEPLYRLVFKFSIFIQQLESACHGARIIRRRRHGSQAATVGLSLHLPRIPRCMDQTDASLQRGNPAYRCAKELHPGTQIHASGRNRTAA